MLLPSRARLTDTDGSHGCSCFDGYEVDPADETGQTCIDINESSAER